MPTAEFSADAVDAIAENSITIIHWPLDYPDRALPALLADRLLRENDRGCHFIPLFVRSESMKSYGNAFKRHIAELVAPFISTMERNLFPVIILDQTALNDKKLFRHVLLTLKEHGKAKSVIFLRPRAGTTQALTDASPVEDLSSAGATEYEIADWSVKEVSRFLADRFELSAEEAARFGERVITAFKTAGVHPYPSWFHALPREFFTKIVELQRKYDLFQHAVDALLAIGLVSQGNSDMITSDVYKRFLTEFAYLTEIEKKLVTVPELMSEAKKFIDRFDLGIGSVEFVKALFSSNLLTEREELVTFKLSYARSFFVATTLTKKQVVAKEFFVSQGDAADVNALWLFMESGNNPDELAAYAAERLGTEVDRLVNAIAKLPNPTFSAMPNPGLLQAGLGSRLRSPSDIISSIDSEGIAIDQKQRIADMLDYAFETMARLPHRPNQLPAELAGSVDSDLTPPLVESKAKDVEELAAFLDESEFPFVLEVACIVLAAGAEVLEAKLKRELAVQVLRACTNLSLAISLIKYGVDFPKMIGGIVENTKTALARGGVQPSGEFERFSASMKGFAEGGRPFFLLEAPLMFISLITDVCKSSLLRPAVAGAQVLPSEGVEKDNEVAIEIFRGLWMLELDTPRGISLLRSAIKDAPKVGFLRSAVLFCLLNTLQWKNITRTDRTSIVGLLEEIYRMAGARIDKAAIIRDFVPPGA